MKTPARRSPRRAATVPDAAAHPHVPLALDWIVSYEWQHNGRRVVGITELSIVGESGRFQFRRYVVRPNGTAWLDVFGGPAGRECLRSFRPDRVRTVHRLTRTRANAA